MKLRKETSGFHYFDRISGLHVLLNECLVAANDCAIAPRTVSIALTNICDSNCPFCYTRKSNDSIDYTFAIKLAAKIDELGSLEITIGGGEPLLYGSFSKFCNWVWNNTTLGISVTTNGHYLSRQTISEIKNKISFIRFSIDGIEPYYSKIRGKPLDSLLRVICDVQGKIPFGINAVVSPGNVPELNNVIELGHKVGAENILIIPERSADGSFKLAENEWVELNKIMNNHGSKMQLYTTYDACDFLNVNCLKTEDKDEFLFAHISADRQIKINSFSKEGIEIKDINNLGTYFNEINKNKGVLV